jgi:hypothetical protein
LKLSDAKRFLQFFEGERKETASHIRRRYATKFGRDVPFVVVSVSGKSDWGAFGIHHGPSKLAISEDRNERPSRMARALFMGHIGPTNAFTIYQWKN